MKNEISVTTGEQSEMGWTQGTVAIGASAYRFEIKHFDEPSHYGIRHGRISKLWLALDNECKASYDRGWDKCAKETESKAVIGAICKMFN